MRPQKPQTVSMTTHQKAEMTRACTRYLICLGVYLLVVSDPLLSSLDLQICYHLYASRHGKLQPNTLALLAEPRLSVAEIGKKGDTAFGKNS